MALKRKITTEEFEGLNEVLKAEYKEKDGAYFLDAEDASSLQNALEREREEKARLKTDLETFKTDLANLKAEKETANADKNRKTKDYDALEADYNRKLSEKETAFKTSEQKLKDSMQKMLVDNRALEIATDAFGENAEIMIPHIKARLQADFDGDMPTTRVLDKNGQPSANTLDELKKEFVDNPRFAPIVVASRASGGSANGKPANGSAGNKKPEDMDDAERAQLFRSNPEAFYQAFPQSRAV